MIVKNQDLSKNAKQVDYLVKFPNYIIFCFRDIK